MQLIRGLHNLDSNRSLLAKGCVLTIGNFDGVHLGHQKILSHLRQKSLKLNLPNVVMLFEPLPVEFFCATKCPVRLMNLREKLENLRESGLVDIVLLLKFNNEFANQSANNFVEQLLVNKLNVKKIIIGDDFKFAKNRSGDFAFLKNKGKELGMEVEQQPTFQITSQRVSSTRIRQTLLEHDLEQAKTLLGKPFEFRGRVIHGKKLGRQLGFRTLNLNPKRKKMPVEGVYSVYVTGLPGNSAEQEIPGIANIGIRPTIDGQRPSIEVHLFNWNTDVYGQYVSIKLHQFIRPEQKFNGLDELKAQIILDVKQAKKQLNLI